MTELVTGVDLVQLQLSIAMGERLPMRQEDVKFSGHAVELRINAEDVMEGFRPSIGTIERWSRSSPVSVREECGYGQGGAIPPFYDSLIGKVITWGEDRERALMRMRTALDEIVVDGIRTNIPLHQQLVRDEAFMRGGVSIHYLEKKLKS